MSSNAAEAIRKEIDLFESNIQIMPSKEGESGSLTIKIEAIS